MPLTHSYFFDFSDYAHASLFDSALKPWETLAKLEAYIRNQRLGAIEGKISELAHLVNREEISIGEGSIVEPGAYIQGPCIIGKNCTIRHGAYIRGNVLTGSHCVIGHDTEVKGSIFLNHSNAAHFNYVGNSIIGNHVNLGAGVKCANFRLDKQMIRLKIGDKIFDTHKRKLGAIIGDYTQIGCNAVIYPGTLIGKNVCCFPNLTIREFIFSGSKIKPAIHPIIEFPADSELNLY